jgi:LysM repeat protein
MDKGIKIAILVACVLSLGFGLIWDKIIDGARSTLVTKPDAADMGPSKAEIRVGDLAKPSLFAPDRPEPAVAASVATLTQPATAPATVAAPGASAPGKHKVKDGETLSAIAERIARSKERVPYLNTRIEQWKAANPGVVNWERLRPGTELNIPS